MFHDKVNLYFWLKCGVYDNAEEILSIHIHWMNMHEGDGIGQWLGARKMDGAKENIIFLRYLVSDSLVLQRHMDGVLNQGLLRGSCSVLVQPRYHQADNEIKEKNVETGSRCNLVHGFS